MFFENGNNENISSIIVLAHIKYKQNILQEKTCFDFMLFVLDRVQ